ncbi:MAG: DUF3710 domain-containing protein [Actinobacteria bacterium]|nr:DUF3710 domain-containing protein [Actinomycetota bacterium]NBY15053.1 DUF3710 domain-containing protein [Actinomycetota bacterium]
MTESLDSTGESPAHQIIDFGSLRLPLLPNLQISMNIDQETMQGISLGLALENCMADLQVFAQAKDELLWPGTRDSLVAALAEQGVDSEIVIGNFGSEIRTTMPYVDRDGNNIVQSVRFVGIDGDRWFLRIAISGTATFDDRNVAQIDELLQKIVVVRGEDAKAPGELLVLTFPDEPTSAL